MMHPSNGAKSYLPVPDIGDQRFKQRNLNDLNRHSKRPPKLYQKFHDSSYYNRSINQSIPQAISFREENTSKENSSSSLLSSIYKADRPESYFEQCFDVIERIGEGSFGEVFKVRSKCDGRLYAIKKSIKLFRGESYRQERIEEVRRYEQFSNHEHCITLHQAWEQNDLLYMQLELCQSNLETFAAQNANLSESRIWDILVDLLLALKALHDQNLVHLDIKLENIMINEEGACKLGDFGLVFDLSRSTLDHAMEGDSRYVAPELLQGRFTKAADIFSLGITTLELACTLELPKNGPLWQELRNGIFPEEFIGVLSVELQNTIKWMMHPDPASRPDVNSLLNTHRIRKILESRRMIHRKVIKWTTKFWNNLKLYLESFATSIISALRKYFQLTRHKHSSSTKTSTPCQVQINPPSDDSFLKLEDSDIGFDESPRNKSTNLLVQSHIVNSTPLNHNPHGNSRHSRSALSRTSLVFDDVENTSNVSSGSVRNNNFSEPDWDIVSPIKCKKLFEISDDSD